MVTICQTCGDGGFSNALIFCDECQVYAVHCYCLAILPATFDEYVLWLCEDCESIKNLKQKSKKRKVNSCSLTNSKVAGLEKSSSVQLHDADCLKTIDKNQEFESRDALDDHITNEGVESHESKNSKLDVGDLQQLETNCSDDEQKDENHGRRHGLDEGGIINEEGGCIVAIPLETIFPEVGETGQKLEKKRNDMDEDCFHEEAERRNGLNEGSLHEVAEPCNNNYQLVISPELSIIEQSYIHAKPIEEPIWRGSLSIQDKKFSIMVGLVAHVSNLACLKVSEEAKSMPTSLSPELLPRSIMWPKGFAESGPRDDSIALYFFPDSVRNEKAFDSLVNDMIQYDIAMRVIVQNAELLIFSSTLLPIEFWRFQAKFYLWGVFKGKRSTIVAVDAVPEKEKHPLESSTWDRRSPVSPLSNGSNGVDSVHSTQSPSVL
ncbi:uncharacterized protein LOC8285089 isoform X2 [Ricinus communis]|uniref:uncharacterized protein LOC8285089 isoform X1 n=1 Tax=Ricinus communis TaxID=3988 RepID=UPI00201A8BDF|nr:uncharacterized protein LOC8285089 isoform X1 [Ricinus communis]XP_015579035.2 uncharacterized protein LOC8285089 isoform X2 [Ricinus communis]